MAILKPFDTEPSLANLALSGTDFFSLRILICSSISICSLHLSPFVFFQVYLDAVQLNPADKTLLASTDGVQYQTVSMMSSTHQLQLLQT